MALILALLMQATPSQDARATACEALADSVVATVDSFPDRAVRFAQRLRRECRDAFTPLFTAGRAINRVSRFEYSVARDDRGMVLLREEAQRLLDRAVQLQANDAAAWFEYAMALKKQGGLQVDALRAVRKALALADEMPDSTPSLLLASIRFQQARYLQDWVDRFRGLRDLGAVGTVTPECGELGVFCENYIRPEQFNARLLGAQDLAPDFQDLRDRVIGLYETVLRLDPAHAEAAERYGRELALGDEWERLAGLARDVAGRGIEPAFFAAVEAMANDLQGRYSLAHAQFAAAIPSLPDSIRRWYDRPPRGLDTVPDFWARSRPLWLLPYNEMQLEYWTRLTYAFLVFRDREAEAIGPESPEGDALIRYGWPSRLMQVERDASSIVTGLMLDNARAMLSCNVITRQCPPGAGEGQTTDFSIGRWVIWMYGPDRPSLIFEKRPGMLVPRHVWDAQAEEYAKVVRQRSPMTFTSKVAPSSFRLPAQVVRLKGEDGKQTDVAIYALVPAKAMGLPARDSVATGLFVFRDAADFPIVTERRDQFAPGEALELTYRMRLPPGRYATALEALAAALGTAANARDSLLTPVWDPAALALSDLLIAHSVEQAGDGVPASIRELRVVPSRTLEVASQAVIWAVWEVYGLPSNGSGTARYQVNLALRDLQARSTPLRLLERLGVGRREGRPVAALEWTAERRLAPDGRALEYVAVQLPEDATGTYELVVTVTDPATGRSARINRSITVSSTK